MEELELYLHIPFCVRKCAYCDFLSAPATPSVQEAYVNALKQEIRSFPKKEKYRVRTVFFGGGTPSILLPQHICALMELMQQEFCFAPEAEVSLECNPGTADRAKLEAYRSCGINRLSFGLQSADDAELALLGRIHTWDDFCRTYEAARKAGFSNLNVDLMSALPGQSAKSWAHTLERVLAYRPEHISAYSLIIEEGTPFYERYHADDEIRSRGDRPQFLPSEEEEREMYRLTEQMLARAGMHRYEISNYALPGFDCLHNKGYWQGCSYAGFGLGASSLLSHVRYRNSASLEAYLAGDFSGREAEALTAEDEMAEFMILGLRMMEGVSAAEFARRFGVSVSEVYGVVLAKQEKLGLLIKNGDRIYLSPRGIDLSNTVMAEFL